MEQDNLPQELVSKIDQLSQLLRIHGAITNDQQLLYIAETIRVVLHSANDYETAMALKRHVQEYINEIPVIKGEKPAAEFLVESVSEERAN